MRRRHVQTKLVDQARKSRSLALRQVQDEPRERRRVDDRMLERALETASDKPGVEGVVAVLDEDGALREPEETASGVPELRRADQHRAVDVMALARVRVNRGAAVDERVEEGQRLLEREALGADLEDEKRSVAGRLDVEGDELRVLQRRVAGHLRRVDGDLVPRHELRSPARFQVQPLRRHDRAVASARRAHAISSPLSARKRSTATAYTAAPATIGMATSQPRTLLSG